jgi:hypothetical protein
MSIIPLTISALVLTAGAVQLVPIIGAIHPPWLERLYGVVATDDTTILLLRHRAFLLGFVGCLLIAGAFWRPWLGAALVVGLASKLSYLLLYLITSQPTASAAHVAKVDVVTATLLIVAAAFALREHSWIP